MRKNTKKKQLTIKDPETLVALGVICLTLSGIILTGVFIDHPSTYFLKGLFGIGLPVMGGVLLLVGLRLLGTKRNYNSFKVIFFLFLFLFSFLGWIQMLEDAGFIVKKINYNYGGILGVWILDLLKNVSLEFAFILLNFCLFISIFGSFNIKPKTVAVLVAKLIDIFILFFKWLIKKIKILFEIIVKLKNNLDKLNKIFLINSANDLINDKSSINQEIKVNLNKDNPPNNDIGLNPIKMVSDISALKLNLQSNSELSSDLVRNSIENKIDNSIDKNKKSFVSSVNEEKASIDLSIKQYANWQLPPLDILDKLKPKQQDSKAVIERKAKAIIETLKSFNIEAKILGYTVGPSVTQFFIDPAAGVKFSKIANLSKDLALTLASPSDLRIELVPGKSYIGIDVPNDIRQTTQLIESIMPIYENPNKFRLGLAVGIDTQGNPVCKDLVNAPHLLIAGATGQGKSVLVNAFIISLLMRKTPDELKFIMIDPKMVEMAPYEGIPHLLLPPITDMSKASKALKWAVNEMEERYKILKEERVRNIEDYITQTNKQMPYIVIIIDEFADLMLQYRQDVESSIIRIAQKARAVGIHLIVATQRPTADVITGLIKSNIPTRIALAVASSTDSRVILDSNGAETLLGKGDLLIKTPNDLKPVRVQGLYIDDKGPQSEFHRILSFIKNQAPNVVYNEEIILSSNDLSDDGFDESNFNSRDPLFMQAAEIIISAQKGSASLLQTKLKIGYARAARLIDELEMAGVVGPQDGPRPREVLFSDLDAFYSKFSSINKN